jgi:hypothetical protein
MAVVYQLHDLAALLAGKDHPVLVAREAPRAQEPVWTL